MAPSRRSARRPTHAHNASASNSKSSHSPQAEDRDSPDPPAAASAAAASNKGGKGAGKPRRVKEEPNDSLNGDADPPPARGGGGKRGGKAKAKEREKEKTPADEPEPAPEDEEDDDSETRCPCGNTDPDISFMIQCDKCRVWQHGVCMGIPEEKDAPEQYFCEECRPDLHTDIPALSEANGKRNKRTQRHTSAMPPPITVPSGTRSPRSHSPATSTKPKSPKRRNTMNSRDAAYDEELKRMFPMEDAEPQIIIEEIVSGGRKKRKRSSAGGEGEPGPVAPKRPRSASSASDVPIAVAAKEPTPAPSMTGPASVKAKPVALPKDPPPPPPPPAPSRPATKKRNAPKKIQEKELSVDASGDAGKRHANQYTYRGPKADTDRRRAEKGDAGYQPTAAARRKAAASEGRATKADKKDAGSPAPQSVSWALPDYLQHLAHILPSETPAPLDVREGDGVEQERGVRVKWPGKRMTIGDMNKRVRNIVEYVAREQAAAGQRRRRVDALVTARAENRANRRTAESLARTEQPVVLDDDDAMDVREDGALDDAAVWDAAVGPEERSPTTERLMSDLMTELLAFQEKFVTKNAASTSRARREAAVVAADRNGAAAAAAAAA